MGRTKVGMKMAVCGKSVLMLRENAMDYISVGLILARNLTKQPILMGKSTGYISDGLLMAPAFPIYIMRMGAEKLKADAIRE